MNNKISSKELADLAIAGLVEKKGKDIISIDIKSIPNSVSDYFIICHGTSNTQVDALVESVDEIIKKSTGWDPYQVEGKQNSEWILMDYVDVVVHIFLEPVRAFFKLEDLWADGKMTRYNEDGSKN